MKVSERSKSTTRSVTPRRVLFQKPPVPKLIQKKARVVKPTHFERNKENMPLEMILPEDAVLIKPKEILNQALYTQSPLGESHVCFPYELPTKISNLNVSSQNNWSLSKESSGTFSITPSVARNNRIKLLSKEFKINRYNMTGYYKVLSHNSTPEPREY